MPDHFNIETPTQTVPNEQQGLVPFLVEDVDPDRYPLGADLVFQRPGELGIVVKIMVPPGAMIMMVMPEQAVHVRPFIAKMKAQHQAAIAKANGQVGRLR